MTTLWTHGGLTCLTVVLVACGSDRTEPLPVVVSRTERPEPSTPSLWASLFQVGAVSRWSTWKTSRSAEVDDSGRVVRTDEQSKSGPQLVCRVESVTRLSTTRLRSSLNCENYLRPNGLDARIHGTWETDGRQLLQVEGPMAGFAIEVPSGEQEASESGTGVSARFDTGLNSWCFGSVSQNGDVRSACFHPQHGPYAFSHRGLREGSDIEVSIQRDTESAVP